jgi:hypothetical protein
LLASTLSACASTCGGDDTGPSTLGELGNGRFIYDCVSATDPVCAPGSAEMDVPSCIAVNASFGMTFDLSDDAAVDDGELDQFIFVESGNDAFVGGTGPFTALRAGRVAMLAREDAQVVDFIHLNLVVPETLELLHEGDEVSGTTFELGVGDIVSLDARASDPDCTILGGAVDLSAESSDDDVASALVVDAGVQIVAVGRGTAMVTVRAGAIEQAVAIEVSTRLEPASSGPDTDTGSGSDTATGSGSDSGTGGTDAGTGSGTTMATGSESGTESGSSGG